MDYTIENTEIFLNSTHYDFVLNETNCISKNDKLENCLIERFHFLFWYSISQTLSFIVQPFPTKNDAELFFSFYEIFLDYKFDINLLENLRLFINKNLSFLENMIPRMCEIINKIFEKYITLHDLQYNQSKDFQDVMNSIFFNLTELRYKVNIHKYITVYLEIIKILDKYHHLLKITNIFHFLNCATVKNYNLEKIGLLSDIFLQTINLCIKLSKNMCLDDENMKIRIIKIIITKIETFCNDKDKLLELFYELQEEHKNIFLFFYNNHSILEKFENDIINYYHKTIFLEIVCNNINSNINYDKRCNYEKNCLLLQGLKTSKYDLRACLKYLITLVRLSKYANTITKEEIYNLVSYNNVISLLEQNIDEIAKSNHIIFNYAFSYIIYLLSDEFYHLSSFLKFLDSNREIPKSVLEYFYLTFIYMNSNLDKFANHEIYFEKNILEINIKIVNDVFMSLEKKNYFKSIISLQILRELLSIHPYYFNFIKDKMNKAFVQKMLCLNSSVVFINLEQQEKWNINFQFGFLITVILYKCESEFLQKYVSILCSLLSDCNDKKILISEICCCEIPEFFSYKLNNKSQNKNCSDSFQKRKFKICQAFIKNNILKILSESIRNPRFIESNTYEETGHYNLKLMSIFVAYLNKNNPLISISCLITYPYICSYRIGCFQFIRTKYIESNDENSFNISCKNLLSTIDFGYMTRFHAYTEKEFCEYKFQYKNSIVENLNIYFDRFTFFDLYLNLFGYKCESFLNEVDNLKKKIIQYNFPNEVSNAIHAIISNNSENMNEKPEFSSYVTKYDYSYIFKTNFIPIKRESSLMTYVNYFLTNKNVTQSFSEDDYYDCYLDAIFIPYEYIHKFCISIELFRTIFIMLSARTTNLEFFRNLKLKLSEIEKMRNDEYFKTKIDFLKQILINMEEYSLDSSYEIFEMFLFELIFFKITKNFILNEHSEEIIKYLFDSHVKTSYKSNKIFIDILSFESYLTTRKIYKAYIENFQSDFYTDRINRILNDENFKQSSFSFFDIILKNCEIYFNLRKVSDIPLSNDFIRKKYKRQKKNINFELNFFVGFLESRIENNLIDLFVNYTGLETKKLILLWNYYKKLVNLQGKFHLAVKRDSVIDSFIENIRLEQPSEVKTQMWFVHFTAEDGTGIGPTFEFFDLYGSILNENEYFIAFANEENT
ncbi:hypothetical protein CWI38_2066p0010, partial [Hamiltosporidium tvaerminnensis]